LGGLWVLEWESHLAETNLSCAGSLGICIPNANSLALNVHTDRRTHGHG